MTCDLCRAPIDAARCPLEERRACLDRALSHAHETCDVIDDMRTAFDALLADALAERARIVDMMRETSEALRTDARRCYFAETADRRNESAGVIDSILERIDGGEPTSPAPKPAT